MPTSVARWESRFGTYWVELFRDDGGYFYRAVGAGGVCSAQYPESDVVSEMESKLHLFQPDRAKTPMHRVW